MDFFASRPQRPSHTDFLTAWPTYPPSDASAIIELLADGASEMPLGEIAERLDLPKSGAHRLLATLVDLGWAEQDRERGSIG